MLTFVLNQISGTQMKKYILIAALAGCGVLSGVAQAQSRETNTPSPRPSIKLKAPAITSSGNFIRCRVTSVAMTGEGLGFTCDTSDNRSYLVATDGGKVPGYLTSVTNLVLEMAEEPTYFRRIRVKEAKGNALKVCGLVRGASAAKDGRTCVQAMAVQISDKDNPVSTSDANPNGPNIPTEPARPD